ncbi:MAG: 50S ribosomal protein L25 [Candidatus Goldbacteria bacterium]|nr:50S ribosomal protein L25 [Candidatus Goldiibacteriota bacterium]
MNRLEIEATFREKKVAAKKLKKSGKIPAIVYGKQTKSMPIEIKIKDIEKTVKTLEEGTLLITLKLKEKDKEEEKTVVIKEIQRDPRTDEIIHADFHQISENEKSIFRVPVFAKGVAEGVKMGGILEHSLRELSLRCLPKDLPSKIEVDITSLKIGHSLTIGDIQLPEGVEVMDDKNRVLFAVVAHKVEEASKPGEVAVGVTPEMAQPELIRKERKEEEVKEEPSQSQAKEKEAAKKETTKKEEKK